MSATRPSAVRLTRVQSRPDAIGTLAVLVASALWGTSGLFVKLILTQTEVTALALAFWRDLTTFAVLCAGLAIWRRRWLRVQRKDLAWLIAMGISLGTFHVFWNLGVLLNGVAVATVQQAAMPAIVAVVARVAWRETLTWSKILAIVLTFAGTVLVSGLDVLGQSRLSIQGFLVGLGIPCLYAAWNIFGKRVRQSYNPFTTLTYAFAIGAACLAPFQFATPQPWPVSMSGLLWFSGLIGLATIGGFSVYFYGLGRLPASVASILAMAEIAFVALYAFLLLGERLSASQVIGALLVVGGVVVLSWPRGVRRG